MRRFALAAVFLSGLAIVGTALAARPPTRPERTAITRVMNGAKVPRACFPLNIKISTQNSRYAAAWYRGANACGIVMGNGVNILKRVGYHRWRIVETGSTLDTQCQGQGGVPPAVIGDLFRVRCP